MKVSNLAKKVTVSLLGCTLMFNLWGTTALAATSITSNQKENYYKQYVEIASEVSLLTGQEVGVLPIENFTENDWVSLDEFRENAVNLANCKVDTLISTPSVRGGSATKDKTINVSGVTDTVSVTGSFETDYYSSFNRQMFKSVNSITSDVASSNATWSQIDYDATKQDSGRTYKIVVSGKYTRSGLYTNLFVTVYFYCDSVGAIS